MNRGWYGNLVHVDGYVIQGVLFAICKIYSILHLE